MVCSLVIPPRSRYWAFVSLWCMAHGAERMVSTILSPLVVTAHANVGGWADFGAFGACGTCVDSATQNCENAAQPGRDLVCCSHMFF